MEFDDHLLLDDFDLGDVDLLQLEVADTNLPKPAQFQSLQENIPTNHHNVATVGSLLVGHTPSTQQHRPQPPKQVVTAVQKPIAETVQKTASLGSEWDAFVQKYRPQYQQATRIANLKLLNQHSSFRVDMLMGCIQQANFGTAALHNPHTVHLTLRDETGELMVCVSPSLIHDFATRWPPGTCLVLKNVPIFQFGGVYYGLMTPKTLETVHHSTHQSAIHDPSDQKPLISLSQYRQLEQPDSDSQQQPVVAHSVEKQQDDEFQDDIPLSQLSNHALQAALVQAEQAYLSQKQQLAPPIQHPAHDVITQSTQETIHVPSISVMADETLAEITIQDATFNADDLLQDLDMAQFDEDI